MEIDKVTPEQRKDAAGLASEYLRLAALVRKADKEGSKELRSLTSQAQACAQALLDRYGLDVADDERGETRFGILIALTADPAKRWVTVGHDVSSVSQFEPYLLESGTPDFYETYGVQVSPLIAASWHRVREEWQACQADMRAAWEEANRVSGDHETVQTVLSRFEHEDKWRADNACYEAEEVALSERHGPREWAIVEFKHKTGKWTSEVRHRIHKVTCSSLKTVLDNTSYDGVHLVRHRYSEPYVRRNEAVAHLRGQHVVSGAPARVLACQRCAKGLEYDAESTAQAEAKAEHEDWMDAQTWAPDGL